MKLRFLFTSLLLTIGGCQTTGDPTQGGLFGWSEKKAQVRQNELEQNLINKQQTLANEHNKANNNLALKDRTSSNVTSIEQTLKTLDAENSKLEKDIRQLSRTKHLKEADAKRISVKLKANAQQRKNSYQKKPKEERINEVTEQNKDLHDELQFLLDN
jgi:hypothetical protein